MSGLNDSVSFEKQKRIFKIIVIGDSNVGKTCLTYRFCGGKFPMKTEATIGVDFRERQVIVDNESVKMRFWDTTGQERFRGSMGPIFYRKVSAVVFVYDVTDIKSFQNLTNWVDEFMMYEEDDPDTIIVRVLVGNKCDCVGQKSVNTSMGKRFAQLHGMRFYETSAADNNQKEIMEDIVNYLARQVKGQMFINEPSIKVGSTPTKEKDECCSC